VPPQTFFIDIDNANRNILKITGVQTLECVVGYVLQNGF